MFESRYRLNPHAATFIPKRSDVIREMAAKSIAELRSKKKANGERTVTNGEIAKLVGHFISVSYKELTNSDKVKIHNYLNKKLLSPKFPAVRPISDLCKIESKLRMKRTKPESFDFSKPESFDFSKPESFDFSKPESPKLPFLLVNFWGLHRHEQAHRPLLSLPYRPDVLKNKIWSVDVSDYKLWNPSCVSKVCECPPMFGYSIPPSFFGVSFCFDSCSEKKIHLNHYPESTDGNEFILTNNWHHKFVDEQPFEDVPVETNNGADLETLTNQFQTIISGICSTLIKFDEEPDCGTENNESDEIEFYPSFWDDSPSNISHVPFSQQNRETLFDDNDHPLLEVSEMFQEQEVPSEVQEMLRKSLSPKKDKSIPSFDVDEEIEVCDPPCSIWCDSVKKGNCFEDAVNKPSESAENPKNSEDAPMVDLVFLEELDSKKAEPVKITLKPTPTLCGYKMKSNQSISSFGDWDPYHYETNVDIGVTANASSLTTSKEKFDFLQKDLINSKSYFRSGSWDESDSGFVSRSSEDDIFDELFEKDSMWKWVTGEDSLWKPLPECVGINTKLPYKRVQDFRCKSLVS